LTAPNIVRKPLNFSGFLHFQELLLQGFKTK